MVGSKEAKLVPLLTSLSKTLSLASNRSIVRVVPLGISRVKESVPHASIAPLGVIGCETAVPVKLRPSSTRSPFGKRIVVFSYVSSPLKLVNLSSQRGADTNA